MDQKVSMTDSPDISESKSFVKLEAGEVFDAIDEYRTSDEAPGERPHFSFGVVHLNQHGCHDIEWYNVRRTRCCLLHCCAGSNGLNDESVDVTIAPAR